MASTNTKNNGKSARSPNFSPAERSLIVDLVECYKHIIEDKRTDMVNVKVRYPG